MKKLLLLLLLLPRIILADAVIFSGNDVKALKQNLDLFGVVKVMSGSVDPSAGAGVAAPVGSAYLSTTDGLFIKTGVANTGWTKNALLPVDLTSEVTGILPTANGGTGSSNLGTGVLKASSGAISAGSVDLASEVSGTLPIGNGGTALSATPTNGQLLIGNGTNYTLAGLTGTANQVSVANGAGSITLSTPQDIATTSNVQFANLTATGTTTLNTSLTGPLKGASGVVSASAVNLATEVTGVLPVANGGTGSSTQNFVDLTTNQTVAGEKTFSNTVKADSIQTTGSSGVQIKNSAGANVADFGPAGTTNASIVGGLNVGGNLLVTGTATASNLSGTNTGDDTIGSQVAGSIGVTKELVFPNNQVVESNATSKQFSIDNGNKNELYNANFEAETVTVGWTISNATSSAETTNEFEGLKTLSLSLTGALSLSQSSTINAARKLGVQMVASIFVKSDDVSDLQLCSLKNGSEDKCTVVGGYVQGSGWRQLTVSFIGGATSNGLKLKSTDTTGTVLVDQAFVGIGSPIVDFTPDMVYSAKISSTGVVSDENTDFINGNCTMSGTNNALATCNFLSGIFTVAPNCLVTSRSSGIIISNVHTQATASSVVFYGTTPSTNAAVDMNILCQKQGADYKTSKAYVASSSDTDWVSCGHTTSDFQGFGTVSSIALQCRKSGQNLKMRGSFVSGTPTSVEARINLKLNGQSLAVFSSQAGTGIAGYASRNVANNGASIFTNLIQANNTYIQLSFADNATRNPIVPQQGATIIDSGDAYVISGELTIPIQGWQDSSVIVGSFQGYNETPGASRVETFSFSYGSTNANTSCTASPCSYLDQIGNSVTSVTRSAQGNYTVNFSKTYSKVKCTWTGSSASSGVMAASNYRCESCSSLAFDTARRSDGVPEDSRGTIICHAQP